MKVIINGREEILAEGTTAAQLIAERKIRKAAVWINGRQLLAAEYEGCEIAPGDEIKLRRILAGG